MNTDPWHPLARYGVPLGGVFLAAALLEPFHLRLNSATVALTFLLVVLVSATFVGRNPALLAALAAMLCFNYFFLPPVRTWAISDSQNLVAWGAFTITAIIAGELSGYARRRAREAERARHKSERLYQELQAAFEQASQAEALRRSEQFKSALLDAVTHDLRTPLTSIKAAATMLLNNAPESRLDDAGRREFLEIINEETDRLNRFIAGTVELARLEASAWQPQQSACEVNDIIALALERAYRLLKTHRLRVEIDENLPLVRADAPALAEVVYTLLDNAAKYSPIDTAITIAARYDGAEIVLSVNDEGRGIAPALREKVFEKFFRATLDAKSKKTVEGLGLGLAIARGLVEAHGGKIWLEEGANGRGTCAKFTIPQVGADLRVCPILTAKHGADTYVCPYAKYDRKQ